MIYLTLLLVIFPAKPDVSIKLTNISLLQSVVALKEFGVIVPSAIDVNGRIGKTIIEVRSHVIIATLNGINTTTNAGKPEPIRWVRVYFNRTTRFFAITSEAFGGIIDLTGILP